MDLMFDTSESTAKLDAALAKAQGQIEVAAKDAVNPHFKSKYADLTAVWGACRPALVANEISVTQWPVHSDDGRLHIVTRVAHGGEWVRCRFSVPVQKQDAQGYGSAVTYAKRYALAAALGVVADEDDDGNGAVDRSRGQSRSQKIVTAQNVAARLRELALHTNPETAADVEKKIAAGLDIEAARKLSEEIKKLATAGAA